MNDELLNIYNDLPEKAKNNLDDFLVYKACYDRDENISDDMVLLITSIAHGCWLDDEYSRASTDYYANYLLDAVYEHGITREQLRDLDYSDIVEAFNNEEDVVKLFKFDVSKYEYWFTTNDYHKYYSDDDGFYIVDEDGMKIKDPHPMENVYDEIFDLLKENKVKSMPLSTHYNIRCIIKNDIIGDKELEERYKEGIKNYKKFCKERNIISRDIEHVTALAQDINLTKEDELYTDESKITRLQNVLEKTGNKDIKKYEYIASFSKGTDYYYNVEDKMYLAIDKNDVIKYFDDDSVFLLKELNAKDNIMYLKPSESHKIAKEFCDYNFQQKLGRNTQLTDSIYKFVKYNRTKEIEPFTGANAQIGFGLNIRLALQEMYQDDMEKKRKLSREMKKKHMEERGKITLKDGKVVRKERIYVDKKTGKEL